MPLPNHSLAQNSLAQHLRTAGSRARESRAREVVGKRIAGKRIAEAARTARRLKKRGCKILGLTVTPVRGDEEDQRRLAALFDESIVYQISRQKLVDANILAVPCFETVKTRIEVEREFTAADYRYLERFGEIAPAVLQRLALNAPRNRLIVQRYLENKHR